ncbi:hypothetical protein FDT66_10030 [Polaribacter aestuariivivens]|uniref:Uncharacterized protein n=1 Tax=Polaribacter aestuariivivens TaxID=2304626 RepID=A0A5S3N2L5_9FLAO|nr:hypothetical protein [Polaribacter aestuariivivens]TMM29453.1 hypothetical protein FDT66_10030 [Polaribacter aestuariivivens]
MISKFEKEKLASKLTNEFTFMVNDLQKEKPEKKVTLNVHEENLYWCINWDSSKIWKTEKYLKEYFQVQIWNIDENYFLMGEHRVEDIFEQLSETYIMYENKTIKYFNSNIDEIIEKTKEGILEAIDKNFESDY